MSRFKNFLMNTRLSNEFVNGIDDDKKQKEKRLALTLSGDISYIIFRIQTVWMQDIGPAYFGVPLSVEV